MSALMNQDDYGVIPSHAAELSSKLEEKQTIHVRMFQYPHLLLRKVSVILSIVKVQWNHRIKVDALCVGEIIMILIIAD